MATKASTAVGSASWISAEKENVLQLLEQEKEEIIFPAQHELEWLNEHMAEIFSRNHFNVTDVFKTPGKLRGKIPRTARKRNTPNARIPLSDVFSSNVRTTPASIKAKRVNKQAAPFSVAQDPEIDAPSFPQAQHVPVISQTDSGYHGSSQEDIEIDAIGHVSVQKTVPQDISGSQPIEKDIIQPVVSTLSTDRRTTEGSFHSAKEEQTAKVLFAEQDSKQHTAKAESPSYQRNEGEKMLSDQNQQAVNFGNDFEDVGSPSDSSTPDRPLVRKSSLTFASLPAREPLKKSMGGRISRTSQIDQTKVNSVNPNNYLPRITGGLSSHVDETGKLTGEAMKDLGIDEMEIGGESDTETTATKLHNKSSTQRLHEKIDMLGKSQPSRPSKSIPSASVLAASQLIQSGVAPKQEKHVAVLPQVAGSVADDDDDWIKPLKSPQSNDRPMLIKSYTTDVMQGLDDDETENEEDGFDMRAPELIAHEERMKTPARISPGPGKFMPGFGHTKSASTATLVSPGKAAMAPPPSHTKTISVSNPSYPSTTPQGSPKRLMDGTISASKSKLQSIMKTAKGLFTSSAGISAAAKMETLSPHALRLAANNMPGLYPSLQSVLNDKPLPPSPPKEERKQRSSAEKEKDERKREKDAKALQKMDEQLERAREKEKQKVVQHKEALDMAAAPRGIQTSQQTRFSPRKVAEEQKFTEKAFESNEAVPSSMPSQSSKLSRPTKPGRDAIQKPRPQPVAIRVGTLSQRMPITTATLASTLQETLPPADAKRPGHTKTISNTSLQSSTSNNAFKTSISSQPTKPKALLAAERKKEQDEREVQRKLEQKRELERKRAAQQEEVRRQEQRQRLEAEKKERERIAAEQAKRAAQQQAIEKKRLENLKKTEQQRNERAANEPAIASTSRPLSRLGPGQPLSRSLINHPLPTNPAKPAKRPFEEDIQRQQASKFGASSQQADAKRRRTEDENVIELPARPTMAGAPIRQSQLGKKPSIFNHGLYAPAPQPPHMSQNQSQAQQFPHPSNPHRIVHPTAMAQFANGAKIPFADAPNPPNMTKTPGSAYPQKTLQLVKSSPQYPNGEAIHLPEIPTDSEDEDSSDEGNGFSVPDWATPGHLTDQLLRQEGMDGDAVFGPIAPLKMEEIFAKGSKDRLKRMRDRTSSANWALSGDGLTLEEVRADREQRERMRLEGGWRYGT